MSPVIELFNTNRGVLVPTGIGSGDTTGVQRQLVDAATFQNATPCWIRGYGDLHTARCIELNEKRAQFECEC